MTPREFVAEWIRQRVEAAPPLPAEACEVIRRLMGSAPERVAPSGDSGRAA